MSRRPAVFLFLLGTIQLPAQEVIAGAANLMHRGFILYPADAMEKRIEGAVTVEATLDERGIVTDARVTSGPEPFRKPVLKSVLEWHYAAGTPSPVQIAVEFKLRAKKVPATVPQTAPPLPKEPPKWDAGVMGQIQFVGLTPQLEEILLRKLPVREGESFQTDMIARIDDTLKGFDEHLRADYKMLDFDGEAQLRTENLLQYPSRRLHTNALTTTADIPARPA